MRLLILVALGACFVAFAVAATTSGLSLIDEFVVHYRPTEAELCVLAGENSGCSGCTLGTQGLCRWTQITGTPIPSLSVAGPAAEAGNCGNGIVTLGLNVPITHAVGIPAAPLYVNNTHILTSVKTQTAIYTCLPATWLENAILQQPNVFADASYICPANPKNEPLLQQPLYASDVNPGAHTGGISLSGAHKLHSKTHHRKLVAFPQDWTVDRTSRYGTAGQLLFSPTHGATFEHVDSLARCYYTERTNSVKFGTQDCATLNNPFDELPTQTVIPGNDADIDVGPNVDMLLNLIPTNKQEVCLGEQDPTGFINTSGLGNPGKTWTETDKWCTRLYMNTYANTRCPAYGQAVSGICESTFIAMFINCGAAHVSPASRLTDTTPFFPSLVGQTCYGPLGGIWPSPPLPFGPILGMRVVDDATPWCIAYNELEISGQFESLLGLHRTVAQLNKVATTECYGCRCDLVKSRGVLPGCT